jgi:serpin B
MQTQVRKYLLSITLLALVSCSGPGIQQPSTRSAQTDRERVTSPSVSEPGIQRPSIASAQSDKERVSSPSVGARDRVKLVGGNSRFAFELYQYLKDEAGEVNLFFSPYSISVALAMTYAGARGGTEQQMADTLHFTLPREQLHPAFNWLDLTLASRGEGAKGKDDGGFRLHIANAIWGQSGFRFLDTFLDTLAVNYGAGLRLLDFASDPEASRLAINDWVSDQTEGRIEEMVPRGAIGPMTRLILTNAIYFNAAWAERFKGMQTEPGAFHLLDGSQVTVPMMWHAASYGYAKGKRYQAVELPYDGHELSMVILLPKAGRFERFEESLDADRVDAILSRLDHQRLALILPRFEFESEFGLSDALAALGMRDAFSAGADFSGMDGTRELFVWGVVHKAFVSVNEGGTEAAAATAVTVAPGIIGRSQEAIQVTVDRPFLFLIRDRETGAILFVGRVLNPL